MTKEEYLNQIEDVIEKGKYKDNWQSLANHKTPDWYYKGKLGIFIHWGIYSVPAYGILYFILFVLINQDKIVFFTLYTKTSVFMQVLLLFI